MRAALELVGACPDDCTDRFVVHLVADPNQPGVFGGPAPKCPTCGKSPVEVVVTMRAVAESKADRRELVEPVAPDGPHVIAAKAAIEQVARRFGLGPCEGGAADEPCGFPLCLAMGCPGEPLEGPVPMAAPVAINVNVVDVAGKRVVALELGEGSAAASLDPKTALALAHVLTEQARKALRPAGLILPGD